LDREGAAGRIGDACRSWGAFWNGAEKALNSLTDWRPMLKATPESPFVLDRRRYGKVLTSVGCMLMYGARKQLMAHFWADALSSAAPRSPGAEVRDMEVPRHDLPAEVNAGRRRELDYVDSMVHKYYWSGLVFLCGFQEGRARRAEKLRQAPAPQGQINDLNTAESRVYLPLASKVVDRIFCKYIFRKDAGAVAVDFSGDEHISDSSLLWHLCSSGWLSHTRDNPIDEQRPKGELRPNLFLVGQLVELTEGMERFSGLQGWDTIKDPLVRIRLQLRTLHRAEAALLGAYVSLDDNIRDLDAAEAGRSLGALYLTTIEHLIRVRELLYQVDACAARKRLDDLLCFQYSQLHAACKRFLVYSIDVYHSERAHDRCSHGRLGLANRALGDLMLLRQEVVRTPTSNAQPKLAGLTDKWEALREALEAQRSHVQDTDPEDCMRQVHGAYRDSLREYLSEIEDYTKRYRFPHDIYLSHNNIMNRQMHFDICRHIRERHWDYSRPLEKNSSYADMLNKTMGEIAVRLFEPQPPVKEKDRREWLREVGDLRELVMRMSPQANGAITLRKLDEPGEGEPYVLEWRGPQEECSRGELRVRRFFRSFDDQMGRTPSSPGASDLAPRRRPRRSASAAIGR
jgi:hypothetical protein